jgi:hypothetical protein
MRRNSAQRQGRTLRLVAVAALASFFGAARAQDIVRDPTERRGEIDITYQYSEEQNLQTSNGEILSPVLTTQSLDFFVRYALKERWTIEGGLPVIGRHRAGDGTDPSAVAHNPLWVIPPHPEAEFVDDGHYHTFVQDLRLAARYLLFRDPVIVEPYLMLGLPASDYPILGAATPSEHVSRQEIGSTFAYRPPFLNWFFSLELGYQYVEKTLGVNKNATRVDAEVVYFANPRIAVKLFVSSKNGHGIEPPTPSKTEFWYHHDQMIRHNYINAGLGVDWSWSERNVVSVSWIQMVHAEDILHLRGALSATLARRF